MKDRRILTALAEDARLPMRRIAKRVGVSPENVRYRLQRLRDRGVLRGVRARISFAGVMTYHLFCTPTKECVPFITAHPCTLAAIAYLGRHPFEVAIAVKDAAELDLISAQFAAAGAHDIRITQVLAVLASRVLPPGFEEPRASQEHGPHPADAKDALLLLALADDAGAEIGAIARRTGMTRDQVAYRMRALMHAHVIMGFRPVVDFAALGYAMHTLLFRFETRDADAEQRLVGLGEIDRVLWAARTIGAWDLVVYVLSRSTDELADAIARIRALSPLNAPEILVGHVEHAYSYAAAVRAQTPEKFFKSKATPYTI